VVTALADPPWALTVMKAVLVIKVPSAKPALTATVKFKIRLPPLAGTSRSR